MNRILMRVVSAVALVGFLASCAQGRVFLEGNDEQKPEAVQAFNSANSDPNVGQPMLTSTYRVSVNAPSVKLNDFCQGELIITVWSNFRMVPQGTIFCELVGQMDIGAMMGATMIEQERHAESGRIVRDANPTDGSGLSFNPPRPRSLGPTIQDPSDFEGYSYKEQSTVTGTLSDGTPINDSGEFYVKVENARTAFNAIHMGKTFDQVIHWRLNAAGFKNSRNGTGIYDQMEFWYNVRPISIPQIKISAKVSDMVAPGDPSGKLGSAFLGTLEVVISLVKEERFE